MSGAVGIEQTKYITRYACILALGLEVNTGMVLSSRGSALDACRIQGILPEGRTTRKGGLRKADKFMKDTYPNVYKTPGSVKLALAPKAK